MNKIAHSVYENLTPKQRVVASIEAEARGDETERANLIRTCPKKTYLQSDANYSDTMDRLIIAAASVEADLRGAALSFLFSIRADPKNAHSFLQNISNIREAWKATITEMGIDPAAMKMAGPPSHPVLGFLEDATPRPDEKGVEDVAALLKELISLE